MQFNLPIKFQIPDPITDPCPTGHWGVDIRGSRISKILKLKLLFDRLSTPVRAKWVRPFSLTWFDLIAQVQPGIPSLEFH